jgi:hypothetical protein
MDSKEAVTNGFATDTLPDENAAVEAGIDLSKFAAKFKNVPAPIAARFAGTRPDDVQGVPETERARLTQRLALLKRLGPTL